MATKKTKKDDKKAPVVAAPAPVAAPVAAAPVAAAPAPAPTPVEPEAAPRATSINGEFDYSEMEVEVETPIEDEPPVSVSLVAEVVPLALPPLTKRTSTVPPGVPTSPISTPVDPPAPAVVNISEIPLNAEGEPLYSPSAWARKKKREAAGQ